MSVLTGDSVYVFNNKKQGYARKGKVLDWETRVIGFFSNDSKYWDLVKYDDGSVEWVNEKRIIKCRY